MHKISANKCDYRVMFMKYYLGVFILLLVVFRIKSRVISGNNIDTLNE